jgi:AcrR family transcriptional regulator
MTQDRETPNERATETREQLIRAGLALFSRQGLEGVRTRQLAEEAGVNQSAIPYHFGGKDGVYAAVLERTAESIVGRLALPRPSVTSPAAAEEALRMLMQDFVSALLDSDASAAHSLLLVREQLQPTGSFDTIHLLLFRPLHEMVTRLVALLRGEQPEVDENILRAHAILGQAIAFAVAREALHRRLGQTVLSRDVMTRIAGLVGTMAVASAKA